MLRGAIEQVAYGRVMGWVYSDPSPTTNQTVLAFLDKACVGSGKVELLREDLLAAGLGNGYLGFSIPIGNYPPQDRERITVRLEGSDFQLVQQSARITGTIKAVLACPFLQSESRVEWMRSQGWLTQHEIDLAKQMIRVGVYDFSLRKARQPGDPVVPALMELVEAAQELLSLLHLEPVPAVEAAITGIEAANDRHLLDSLRHPIAAIWSKRRETVLVAEGSHLDDVYGETSTAEDSMIEYACGPDRLLVVDLRCKLGSQSGATKSKFTIFTTPLG